MTCPNALENASFLMLKRLEIGVGSVYGALRAAECEENSPSSSDFDLFIQQFNIMLLTIGINQVPTL